MFKNSLKMYQNKLLCNFQWIFFVKLLWHCRLNFFCYKNKSKKSTTSNVKGFLILWCFSAIIPFFLPPHQRRSRFSSGCPRQEFMYYIHINYRTMGCAKVSSGPMDNLGKVEICPHLILAVRFVACRFDVLFPDTGDSSEDSFKYVAKDATGHSH